MEIRLKRTLIPSDTIVVRDVKNGVDPDIGFNETLLAYEIPMKPRVHRRLLPHQ